MKLTERTTVPLFAVVMSIPCIAGVVVYAVLTNFIANQALAETRDLRIMVIQGLKEHSDALTRVEIKLGTFPGKQSK